MQVITHMPDRDTTPAIGNSDAVCDKRVLVWDLPTRLGHWMLAGTFALAWLTSESESLRNIHVASGYAFGAILAFRLLWGLVGSRYARFSNFVRSPRAAWGYLASLAGGRPQHHIGHNPAGAWAILALLGLGAISVLSGWLTFNEIGGEFAEELHEGASGFALGVVAIHLIGVAVGSLAHRENLVGAMIRGFKRAPDGAGIGRSHGFAAALLVAWVAAVVTFLMA